MNKERIMVDIDGVIADFHQNFVDFVNVRLDSNYQTHEFHGWNIADLDPKAVRAHHDQYVKDGGYRTIPIFDGSKEGLEYIARYREVILCTSRHPELRDDTTEWLARNKIPYELWMRTGEVSKDRIFAGDHKVGICQNTGIKELVEDSIDTLVLAANSDITAFAVTRAHNKKGVDSEILKGTPNFVKVYGVEGVADYLRRYE